jgi:hypothetical protein
MDATPTIRTTPKNFWKNIFDDAIIEATKRIANEKYVIIPVFRPLLPKSCWNLSPPLKTKTIICQTTKPEIKNNGGLYLTIFSVFLLAIKTPRLANPKMLIASILIGLIGSKDVNGVISRVAVAKAQIKSQPKVALVFSCTPQYY